MPVCDLRTCGYTPTGQVNSETATMIPPSLDSPLAAWFPDITP